MLPTLRLFFCLLRAVRAAERGGERAHAVDLIAVCGPGLVFGGTAALAAACAALGVAHASYSCAVLSPTTWREDKESLRYERDQNHFHLRHTCKEECLQCTVGTEESGRLKDLGGTT